MVQVIALAQLALSYTRSWAANSPNERLRLKAELAQRDPEIAWLMLQRAA
jgi:hypothetical protein